MIRSEDADFGPIGFGNSEVHTIEYRDLYPVVSEAVLREYDVDERDVEIHRRVVRRVMEEHDVLPVAYGMVFKGRKNLAVAMSAGYAAMKKAWPVVEGKVELGVKVIRPKNANGQYDELKREIVECLSASSVDFKNLDLFSDRLLLNTAFLVERSRIDEFSKRVSAVIEEHSDLRTSYSGPWPPYNFVDIHILGKGRKGFRQARIT
ncbi:MAG: GvpL/GvpF family gas vesicle protein [Methanothrix sp.]|uniref:Gas vesicle synthesis GvpLGvpF n=1 Tax=Methanothrix thermoacetophila (strain DSM 6194 / JCM 14653 / NBRC 101360 / PT) TaxID=349307 RepID=A0B583_METTP|nr:Gas vesicle synthesis GvpLGvpF [Methanothrix thermoacetophila PT]MBC7079967.1 GvpL/GvpF family gas vesicle protein [Methanothrix sp.]NPU88116.1 GvpL/GvpF family gas vesicle protein [Methanothrix sp.]